MIKHDSVWRYDRGALRKPEVMPNGWMRVEGYLARSGILEYQRADGSTWREYRPPEEAFHKDAMDSFAFVPLTNNHPPQGFLDADNTKLYQVGSVLQPSQEENKVRAQILVTDSGAIAEMRSGKLELSGGYTCDLELAPGEFEGQRFNAIQRNIRGNHVALVKEGRAGPEVRIRLDSHNATVLGLQTDSKQVFRGDKMVKLNIDGVEYEVSETAAQAVNKVLASNGAIVAKIQSDLEKQTARADAAESDAKKSKEDLAAAPETIRAAIASRMSLEAQAVKILPEAKFDGKTDTEIKRACAEKVLNLKLDAKSDVYVDASFELALKQFEGQSPGVLAVTKQDIAPMSNDSGADPVATAKAKFYEASRNAHLGKK